MPRRAPPLVACSLLLAVAACASLPLPQVDVRLLEVAAAARLPRVDVERGRALLVGACAACHEPVHPLDCPLLVWDEVMPRMLSKSELALHDGQCVRAYVVAVQRASAAIK